MSAPTILLVIGGGISAYKSLELIRLLRKAGKRVRVVLTAAAKQFVTELSVASLSGEPAFSDMFDVGRELRFGHIQLSRECDLIVIAPATADLIAKAAAGLAGDLASALLLATDKKVLLAPAMNVRMWRHPATQRNLATLKGDGLLSVGPNDGDMACGEYGPGRMAEPAEIVAAIDAALAAQRPAPLAGRKALVTAGPTYEAIDPVRFVANRSSGKQGYAVAAALAKLGAETTLISGPTALEAPAGVRRVAVESAAEMLAAVEKALPADVAVFAAAVADWKPATVAARKLKKTGSAPAPVALAENPDILAAVAHRPDRPRLVIGFAAETENLLDNAARKRAAKGCDWIVANDVSQGVFGAETNRVHILDAAGTESWPDLDKTAVGERLAARIAQALETPR